MKCVIEPTNKFNFLRLGTAKGTIQQVVSHKGLRSTHSLTFETSKTQIIIINITSYSNLLDLLSNSLHRATKKGKIVLKKKNHPTNCLIDTL